MDAVAAPITATRTMDVERPFARLGPVELFWLFIAAHLLVFTLLPWALYASPPLDCIEMHSWGQQWEWGYQKHPPLPAWIARGATIAAGGSPVGMYLAAALCVVTSFWAVWRLGLRMVGPAAALIGVMLLECSWYFNFDALALNNNVVLYPCWALSVLAFYHAIERRRPRYWLALGVCLGLGLLTKYSMVFLPATMVLLMLVEPRARSAWRTPGPYLAALAGLLIFLPHLIWAVTHDFPTVRYAAMRASTSIGPLGRLWYPIEFTASQYFAPLPMTIVAIPIAGLRWRLRSVAAGERFDRVFLAAIVLGPFLLHLLVSFALNARLRSMWGAQLWIFAGLLLVMALKIDFRAVRQRRVLIGCAMMGTIYVIVIAVRIVLGPALGYVHREQFAGQVLAQQVERVWQEHENGPLPVVAGEGWLAGNVAFFSDDGPTVYGVMGDELPPDDRQMCAWLDDAGLAATGGVFLWNAEEGACPPEEMTQRLPAMESVAVITVPRCPALGGAPVRVGVAYVPPRQGSESGRPSTERVPQTVCATCSPRSDASGSRASGSSRLR